MRKPPAVPGSYEEGLGHHLGDGDSKKKFAPSDFESRTWEEYPHAGPKLPPLGQLLGVNGFKDAIYIKRNRWQFRKIDCNY